jgi:RimJ/RimL family protein N-acetyltransferase
MPECPECGARLEMLVRGWPSYVQPGLYALVRTCWDCGFKRAAHQPLTFRAVSPADYTRLYIWRHAAAIETSGVAAAVGDRIPYASHIDWCDVTAREPRMWWQMAVIGPLDVGVIRYDIGQMAPSVVHITVAPPYRGEGVASGMLRCSLPLVRAQYPDTQIIAHVKPGNAASRGAFVRAGWQAQDIIYRPPDQEEGS